MIASDRNQPELKLSLESYLGRLVSKNRVEEGLLQRNIHAGMEKISAGYHVQPRFLLALWGIESDYGRVLGSRPIIRPW